jgi:hypothetical protein
MRQSQRVGGLPPPALTLDSAHLYLAHYSSRDEDGEVEETYFLQSLEASITSIVVVFHYFLIDLGR